MAEDYEAYDIPRRATPNQLRVIARLSQALRIQEPIVKYQGEAGKLIRAYSIELKARRTIR